MKFSILLPVLAAGASKQQKKEKEGNRNVERFVASEVTNQCSEQIPSLGGTFNTPNKGSSGAIILNDYRDLTYCKHVVQADNNCEQIKIEYRSVEVEIGITCQFDSFRFDLAGTITPGGCGFFGESWNYLEDNFDYAAYADYVNLTEFLIGPDTMEVNSNTFTFYFQSDGSVANGHVIIDWECVRYQTTTTTTTTTTSTSM